MKISKQIPVVIVGYVRIKLWRTLVILIGCCVALIVIYESYYTSAHPDSFVTYAVYAFGRRFSDNGDVNNSQANVSQINISQSIRESTTSWIDHNCSRYVSPLELTWNLGLGNQMWCFAAALYVAELTGREVVLFQSRGADAFKAAFDLNVKIIKDDCPKYEFSGSNPAFDANLEKSVLNHSETSNKSITLMGYFQSWRYLRDIKYRLRHHFNFRPDTRQVASKFIEANIPPGWRTQTFLRVGIHVRRGDFLKEHNIKFGFTVGTEVYFQKAMKYFVEKYGRTQFIAASLDEEWTKKFIYFNDSALANVTFSFGHTNVQDMAILSMCDHVIMSTGSYGWWSAWLAGGTTIYYGDCPRRNSPAFNNTYMKKEDHFPANWIPME